MESSEFKEIGKTEVVRGTDPKFRQSLIVEFDEQDDDILRFELVNKLKEEESRRYVEIECSRVQQLAETIDSKLEESLIGSTGESIVLSAASDIDSKLKAILQFRATGITKKDNVFGKTQTLFTISRIHEEVKTVLYTSEAISSQEPEWIAAEIKMTQLLNGSTRDCPLKIDIYNTTQFGGNNFCGGVTASWNQLSKRKNARFEILTEANTSAGILVVLQARTELDTSFIDYVAAGLEFHYTLAVDMSSSNGSGDSSLHYRMPAKRNQYQQSISAICKVLGEFEHVTYMPMYGFGARPDENADNISQCFPLNGKEDV